MSAHVDEFLVHYGVMGMKWGRRRSNTPRDKSTESRALRKQSARNLQNYIWEKTKDENIFGNVMTKEQYAKLSTGREYVARNTKLNRITTDPKSVSAGQAYVSRLREDATFYKAALPAIGPQNNGRAGAGLKRYKDEYHELELKTVKKLSSPSEKERFDAFVEILNEPAIKVGKKDPMTGREYLKKNGYAPLFDKKLSTQEFGFYTYDRFISEQGNQDSPINTAYFNKIREKGFNALPDDYDRGRLTKAPMILLDPEGTVKVTSVRRLTTDEINKAQRDLEVPKDE
jgi:hypothetical protein